MTTATTKLGTQVQGIACSKDGRFLRVARIARGKATGSVDLDASTLQPVEPAATTWLPVATLDNGLRSKTKHWTVGKFGQGLFVKTLAGKPVGAPEPLNSATELTVTSFAVSTDERWAAVGSASGFVSVFDTHTGEERWAERQHKGHVTALAFSPDGQRIYSGNAQGQLCAVDLPGSVT